MSEQKDNQALEEYLKGDTDLSRRYRAESGMEPPAHLDAAIISAAKNALNKDKAGAGPSTSRWYVPLSLAAVVVISFSVVFKIYDQDGQQEFSRQTELKSEKPAAMLEERMEHDAGEAAGIIQDKIISNKSVEIEDEPGARSAQSFRKDATPDASALSREIALPAAPAPGSVAMPAESGVMESFESTFSADSTGATDTLAPEQWFEIINQLWFDGDEDGAYRGLKNFLEAYPDYPLDELKMMLPQEMDFSEIVHKRALTP